MRPAFVLHLLVAAMILVGAGCSSNKGKIEGTKWSSQAGVVKGVNFPAGFLQVEFGKDGGLYYRGGAQIFKGTYSLGMEDNVTLNLDRELAGRKVHVEQVIINGNHLTMIDSDGTQLTFNKVP